MEVLESNGQVGGVEQHARGSLTSAELLEPGKDLQVQGAHLPVGDNEEVAAPAGGVQEPHPAHVGPQPAQRLRVMGDVREPGAQLVEEHRSDDLQDVRPVSYTHLRAHETDSYLVCRL